MARLRSRFGIALTVLLTTQSVATLAFADDPKSHLTAADKAARAKDWGKALEEYEAANKAQASSAAQEGIANAHYELKHDVDAYAAYDAWLKQYGGAASKPKKATAEARLKELGDKTGLLSIAVSEPGATITVDDKPVGTTPLAAPLRLPAGPHRVRVTKDGFAPFDKAPNIIGGSIVAETAKLEAQSTKGRLAVKEKSGQAIRVVLDGVDVGDAPWSGEVPAGEHEVRGRSVTLAAPPQKVTVERGKTLDVELVAHSATAQLRVVIEGNKGTIYVDDKLVGEGQYTSEVPAGPHKIRVQREGFDPVERDVVLEEKQPALVSIALTVLSKVETGAIKKESRPVEGIYGGLGLMGTAQPGGMKSSMAKLCSASDRPAEITSCDEGGGLGAGLSGFLGYHWDPVGVELFFAGQYDTSSPKTVYAQSNTNPGIGPDPARTEDFSIRRLGALGAVRIRLTLQGEKLRFSMGMGVGFAFRTMVMERDATAAANANFLDIYVPSSVSYWSPAVTFEPTVQYRITPTTALSLGVELIAENATLLDKNAVTTPRASGRTIGPSGITTPAYQLATEQQIFIGPIIGVMFGP
jgi:hypothetical protein